MLGVAMVAGTFMLKGSVDKAFDDIFAEANEGSTSRCSRSPPSTAASICPSRVRPCPSRWFARFRRWTGSRRRRVGSRTRPRSRFSTRTATGSGLPAAARRRSRRASSRSRSIRSPGSRDRRRRPTTKWASTRSRPTRRATRSVRRSRSAASAAPRNTRSRGSGDSARVCRWAGASLVAARCRGRAGGGELPRRRTIRRVDGRGGRRGVAGRTLDELNAVLPKTAEAKTGTEDAAHNPQTSRMASAS